VFASREHSWQPVSIGLGIDRNPEPPSIGGIAYPGRRHVWSGEPETLKSLVALILCVEEIRAGRTAFYVDCENGLELMAERLHQLGLAAEEIEEHLVYIEPAEPLTDEAIRADVERLVDERRPSLVVFDSYAALLALHELDDWKGTAIERYQHTVVDLFRTFGAATIHLDHLAKNRESRGRYSIGSERKIASTDVHLTFEIVQPFGRGRRGLARLVTHKDRPGFLSRPKAAEIELASDPETFRITWTINVVKGRNGDKEGVGFRPTVLMERVSRYLEQQPEPVSRKNIETNVQGNVEYLRLAMDAIVREDYASEASGPRKARLLESMRPFREHGLVHDLVHREGPDLVSTEPHGYGIS
jgi:hypothetical protein